MGQSGARILDRSGAKILVWREKIGARRTNQKSGVNQREKYIIIIFNINDYYRVDKAESEIR